MREPHLRVSRTAMGHPLSAWLSGAVGFGCVGVRLRRPGFQGRLGTIIFSPVLHRGYRPPQIVGWKAQLTKKGFAGSKKLVSFHRSVDGDSPSLVIPKANLSEKWVLRPHLLDSDIGKHDHS